MINNIICKENGKQQLDEMSYGRLFGFSQNNNN